MTKNDSTDWTQVTFVVGTREDFAPFPLPMRVFARDCGNCGAHTLTEKAYPRAVALLYNVCAAEITGHIEADSSTQLLYALPVDVKARLIELAFQKHLSIEQVFTDFLTWKLGRATKAHLSPTPEKKAKP